MTPDMHAGGSDPGTLAAPRRRGAFDWKALVRRHTLLLTVLGTATVLAYPMFVLRVQPLFLVAGILAVAGAVTILLRPLWGFYALVATFSAEHLLELSGALTATKLLGGLVFLGWALQGASRRQYRIPHALILLGAPAMLVSASLSMLAVESVSSGVQKLATIAQLNLLVLVGATLLRSAREVRNLAWVILASTTISAVAGLQMLAAGQQENLEGLTTNRNALGIFLAMCVPLIFLLYPGLKLPGKIGLMLIAGMFFVCEALSYSREGFMMMVMALMLSVMFGTRAQRTKVGVVILSLACSIAVLLPGTFWERVSTIRPAIESGAETVGLRYQLWRIARRMIRDHPVLGVGPGNYRTYFMRYGGLVGLRRPPLVPHNAYLGVSAELGLVGGTVFGALCLTALATYVKARRLANRRGSQEVSALATAFGISTLVFVCAGMVGNMEYMKYFWVFVTLSAVLKGLAMVSSPAPEAAATG